MDKKVKLYDEENVLRKYPSAYRCPLDYRCPLAKVCLHNQRQLGEHPREVALARNDLIYRNAKDRQNVYLVTSGIVTMAAFANTRSVIMGLFGPGHALGETEALEDSNTNQYALTAFTDCTVCKTPARNVRQALLHHPELLLPFTSSTHNNYAVIMRHVWTLSTTSLPERINRLLMDVASACPIEGDYLVLATTQENIAQAIGSERSSVTHALKRLEKHGYLKTEYRRILLPRDRYDIANDSTRQPISTWKN